MCDSSFAVATPPGHLGTLLPPYNNCKAVGQRLLVLSYAMEAKWGANELLGLHTIGGGGRGELALGREFLQGSQY